MMRPRAIAFLAAIAVSGCDDSVQPAAEPANVVSVDVEAAAGALVRTLSVDLDEAAAVEVDYWTAASPRLRVESDDSVAHHDVLVTRLIPNAGYNFEVRAVHPSGVRGESFQGTFISDTLPTALADVRFDARGEASASLVLLEFRSAVFSGLVVVDQDGQVVWFWEALMPQGVTRLNGDFVVVSRDVGLFVVSPEGEQVAEVTHTVDPTLIHHDVIATPEATVIFLTRDGTRTVNDTTWTGDRIWEWDPATDEIKLLWDTFDFLDIVDDRGSLSNPGDWGHANALSFGPRGNILISLHHLSQVVSIAADYQSLEWRLGGVGSDFELDAEGVFIGQHTAAEVEPGRVLLFDNGNEERGFSRALELEYDELTGTAEVAWEFRPFPDVFSRIISSARRLPDGKTLVAFGAPGAAPHKIYEVSQDGSVDWFLEVDGSVSIYRANPLTDIAGEVALSVP